MPDNLTCHLLTYLDGMDLHRVRQAMRVPPALDAHWRTHWCVGDRLDARDERKRWYAAKIIDLTEDQVHVHYEAWNRSFDEWFQRNSPELDPLYTHTENWRAQLRRGQLVEVKDERERWHIAQIRALETTKTNQSWCRLTVYPLIIGIEHMGNGRAQYRNLIKPEQIWTIEGYDSHRVAPTRTHLRSRIPLAIQIDTLYRLLEFAASDSQHKHGDAPNF